MNWLLWGAALVAIVVGLGMLRDRFLDEEHGRTRRGREMIYAVGWVAAGAVGWWLDARGSTMVLVGLLLLGWDVWMDREGG